MLDHTHKTELKERRPDHKTTLLAERRPNHTIKTVFRRGSLYPRVCFLTTLSVQSSGEWIPQQDDSLK